jgi:twitching motility protein PilT
MAGLADVLVEQGVLTPEQVATATGHAGESGSFAKSVVELGFAVEDDLVRALAQRLGLEFASLEAGSVDRDAAHLLTREQAVEAEALPIAYRGQGLLVAIGDPNNRGAGEAVRQITGLECTLVLSPRRALLDAIRHLTDPAPDAPRVRLDPTVSKSPISNGFDDASKLEGGTGRLKLEETAAIDLNELLLRLLEEGGSDLHLTVGIPPAIRVNGDIKQLDEYPVLTPDELQKMLYAIMTQKQREQFENELELDMSYAVPGHSRFRVNIFRQRDALGSVMRAIPFEIKTLEELGMPESVASFAYQPRGFVLVTGPTGSGKSTTLAALVDLVNKNRAAHIMTVEDPIEFLHQHQRSVVNQREVGTDTHTFTQALKHVLRQDPDVILVGELRDLETIQIALTAAETGHLVFGTLHTQDAPQTIDRMIDVFPPDQQEQIRVMLSGALKGVICQTLMKTADGKGRVAAVEIMKSTSGIKNLIREGKTHQIYSAIQAGKGEGMVAMDQSLATLVKMGKVNYDEALEKCNNVPEFNRLVGRG